jgi:hypothetical protein
VSEPDYDDGPYVCPGCYAIGGEAHASWCIDAEMEREDDAREMGGGTCEDDDICDDEPDGGDAWEYAADPEAAPW